MAFGRLALAVAMTRWLLATTRSAYLFVVRVARQTAPIGFSRWSLYADGSSVWRCGGLKRCSFFKHAALTNGLLVVAPVFLYTVAA